MHTPQPLEDMDDWPDLPSSAYTNARDKEIDNDWVSNATPAEQASALLEWFQARFQDPAHETPYMSSEGGYIWVHGGPYDAKEQLEERFSGLVPDEVIMFVAEYVEGIDGVWEWAPTDLIYYDAGQDLIVHDKDVPLQKLEECLDGLLDVLNLQGDRRAIDTARRLAYAGVVSALETFLWETMAYWVDHDQDTIRNLIKNHPEFRERKIKLGDIFELYDGLTKQVKVHMQRMAWHRWDEAARFLEHGLGVTSPSFRAFDEPTKTRHDIIHRSGHDVEGQAITITIDQVRALAEEVQQFATQLHAQIDQAKTPPNEAFEDTEF